MRLWLQEWLCGCGCRTGYAAVVVGVHMRLRWWKDMSGYVAEAVRGEGYVTVVMEDRKGYVTEESSD